MVINVTDVLCCKLVQRKTGKEMAAIGKALAETTVAQNVTIENGHKYDRTTQTTTRI